MHCLYCQGVQLFWINQHILSIRLRDNSVHLHEFDVDMHILIDKALQHVYML